MAGITLHHEVRGLKEVKGRLTRLHGKMADYSVPLTEHGLYMKSRAIERLNERQISSPIGRFSNGTLGKSINTTVSGDKQSAETKTNSDYARLQQEGGEIKPTDGKKAVAIPLDTKVARQSLWPRDFQEDELQFIPIKNGGDNVGLLVEADRQKKVAAKAARQNKRLAKERKRRSNRIRSKSETSLNRLKKKRKRLIKQARRAKGDAKIGLLQKLAEVNTKRRRIQGLKRNLVAAVYDRSQRVKTAIGKALFLLKRKVQIPGRPYLYPDDASNEFLRQRVKQHLAE